MPLTEVAQDRQSAPVARGEPRSAEGGRTLSPRMCSHCGLPVPEALVFSDHEYNFCCAGCQTVFRLLQGSGLTDYYAFRERIGQVGRKVEGAKDEGYAFDSPSFQRLYCRKREDGSIETELLLEGVHCAACVWLVERLPRLEPAVLSARLDMSRATVSLLYDPQKAALSRIATTLTQMGYAPRPVRGNEADRMRRAELRSLLIRIGVAGACAGNVMLMAFALYSGAAGQDGVGTMDPSTTHFFEVASLIVSLPSLWAAGLFFRGATAALRTRTPHMDLPIALGIFVAFAWGAFGALGGKGEIYFDSITTLIFFLLIGRYLSRRHQMAESDALELLDSVVPGTATMVDASGTPWNIAVSDIEPGARVVVVSGGVIPVDGEVVEGTSSLDKSLLSGESKPIPVSVGTVVEAGALNLGSRLLILAHRSGNDTRIAALMQQVEQALSTRTPLIHKVDRLAGGFTVAVILLALFVGVAWSFHSAEAALERALSLLIVACPCALGMATPLTLSAAVRQAARRKQLVFSPGALEALAEPTELVLDKTGTLTEGKLEVIDAVGDLSLLAAVAALEVDARHPLARALTAFAKLQPDFGPREVGQIRECGGKGLSGVYLGETLMVGAEAFVIPQAELKAPLLAHLSSQKDQEASPVYVAWAGQVRCVLWLGDVIRKDAVTSLIELRKQGHRLHLLSGDNERTVQSVAAELARRSQDPELFASVLGGVDPSGKLARVRELQKTCGHRHRPVVMVGDGVNDAGALAAADVGVAVSGAAEASRLSADVYLFSPGVSELERLYQGSRNTLRVMTRGIVFSLFYNALGISGAALGLLGPLGAAVLMPLSSLTVVTNAYRSTTFQAKGAEK